MLPPHPSVWRAVVDPFRNRILCGDALTTLKKMPDESVDCVITSPPYWGLRDYRVKGQLGLEPRMEQFVSKLCDVLDEVRRVLKPTGTCWVNLGDSYGTQSEAMRDGKFGPKNTNNQAFIQPKSIHKCLLQIPARFAIEMINRGWILRSEIIWWKPNAMPSSVQDRFTVDFEKLFFFVRTAKYWFETQHERAKTPGSVHVTRRGDKGSQIRGTVNRTYFDRTYVTDDTRIKRCVWGVPTQPYRGAHFAVFPPALIATPIRAGCPEWVCMSCGSPYRADASRDE